MELKASTEQMENQIPEGNEDDLNKNEGENIETVVSDNENMEPVPDKEDQEARTQ